jgi:antitoxin (DNA-binding transcriptional repressor) of toxin-antitoxin stability system
MKTIDIHDATAPLSEYAALITTEPVIITIQGKPYAALVDIENVDFETLSLSLNPEFIEIIQHSRRRQEQEGGISSEEIRRRMELDE